MHYAWRLGDNERAKMLGEGGLAIARDLGDKRASAYLLVNLGIVARRQLSYAEAAERFEEAEHLARETGDQWLVSACLSQQGVLARVQGDLVLATTIHEEALAAMREVGDIAMVAYTLRCLGVLAFQQGDYQGATEVLTRSLRLSRETGFRWMIFECLVGLAGVSRAHGRSDRAARLLGAAEALREVIGHRPSPQDGADYDRRLSSTREELGEAAFAAAWAEGRAMTLEQAIEYALAADTRTEEGHGSSSNVAPE